MPFCYMPCGTVGIVYLVSATKKSVACIIYECPFGGLWPRVVLEGAREQPPNTGTAPIYLRHDFVMRNLYDRAKPFSPKTLNPLEFRGNYSATSNNMKLIHWPLMGGLLHLVQRGGLGELRPRPVPSSL